jgi:hypothetical protein
MPLTMRPTGLASPVDQDREDYTIYSGDWAMESHPTCALLAARRH